jgi:DNA-binding NarL/FixJ family response regulator
LSIAHGSTRRRTRRDVDYDAVMIAVVLIAASADRRAGLRARIEGPGIDVVAERRQIVESDITGGRVDVLVVDGAAAFASAMELAADSGEVAVVGILDDPDEAEALVRDADVRGWALLPGNADAGELGAAIAAAASGLGAWPASWSAHLTGPDRSGPLVDAEGEVVDRANPSDRLTAREQEVLELLSEGLSNRRIAERLGMSEHTAKFHVAAIYGKLDVSGRAAAVNQALRRGLIKI